MLAEEPTVTVRNLLAGATWDSSVTLLADAPRVHTGWFDYASGQQQVTVTNPEESTVNGGETGITAGTGDGGVAKVRAGTMLVNGWAGTRDDCEGAGTASNPNPNPKSVAYGLAREIDRIVTENAGGGTSDLNSLSVDPAQLRYDRDDDSAVVYRYELTVRYTYAERTHP